MKKSNISFYGRFYKMVKIILERMEGENKFADKLPENVYGAEFLNDYLLGKIDEKESIEKIAALGRMSDKEFKEYLERRALGKR